MLSLKSRVLALAATGALAALLAVPAFAQAFWWDEDDCDASGGIVGIEVYAEARSTAQSVSVTYQSDGPTVTGPTSVNVAAGQTFTSFGVQVGAGNSGDTVQVTMSGPTSTGYSTIYLW